MEYADKNPLKRLKMLIIAVERGARGAPMNQQYIPVSMVIHARNRLPEECPFRETEAGDC